MQRRADPRVLCQAWPLHQKLHGKDITLSGKLTVHLDEIRPGLGGLDYETYLTELNRLAADTPLMLEHMKREDYAPAAEYVALCCQEGRSQFHRVRRIIRRWTQIRHLRMWFSMRGLVCSYSSDFPSAPRQRPDAASSS